MTAPVPVPGGKGRKIAIDEAWVWYKETFGATRS